VAPPTLPTPTATTPTQPLPVAAVDAAAGASIRRAHHDGGRGWVSIYAEPWAYVVLDGKRIGPTPLMKQPVAAGVHRLRLERAGIRAREERVKVQPGQTRLVNLDLQPERS
jgi:hypothetical protein